MPAGTDDRTRLTSQERAAIAAASSPSASNAVLTRSAADALYEDALTADQRAAITGAAAPSAANVFATMADTGGGGAVRRVIRVKITSPATATAGALCALGIAGTDVAAAIADLTSPDVPRCASITFTGWTVGDDVTLTGTFRGAAQSETFVAVADGTVAGVKPFTTLTNRTKVLDGTGTGTGTIDTNTTLGLADTGISGTDTLSDRAPTWGTFSKILVVSSANRTIVTGAGDDPNGSKSYYCDIEVTP